MSEATYTKSLSGKVAIVTGSSRGIGAAIALRLAAYGANVAINYLSSSSSAEDVAKRAGDLVVKAITVQANVAEQSDINNLFATAKKEFGRIDVVEDVTGEEFDKVIAVNVKAQFFVAQAALNHLEDGGRVILISSISAVMGITRHAVYAAFKAAIQGMVKCLAWDFGKRGITVNAIAPGRVKTDMYEEVAKDYLPGGDKMAIEEIDERISGWSPLGRPGFPDDVAGLLSSPESQWLTGQTLHVSGGAHMASRYSVSYEEMTVYDNLSQIRQNVPLVSTCFFAK